jgi:hypothetical protein
MKWYCALLMLTVSSVVAEAAETSCFEIYRNTTGAPAGAILLNKCTGQTWLLSLGNGAGSWFPVAVSKTQLPPMN